MLEYLSNMEIERVKEITAIVDKDPEILAMRAEGFEKLSEFIDTVIHTYATDKKFMDKVHNGDPYMCTFWDGICEVHTQISNYCTVLRNPIAKKHNEKFEKIIRDAVSSQSAPIAT